MLSVLISAHYRAGPPSFVWPMGVKCRRRTSIRKTVSIALIMGQPEEIPPDEVEKLHHHYTHVYGQK